MVVHRGRVADLAVAAVVLGLGWPAWDGRGPAATLGAVPAVLVAGILLARRSWPVTVLVVAGILTAATFLLEPLVTPVAGLLAAIWTVADRCERRLSLRVVPAVVAPLVILATVRATHGERLSAFLLITSLACAAWALGAQRRARRQVVDALTDRADRLERERLALAESAAAGERLRILREMHDALGHSLSVIAVQADAARAVLASDPRRSDQAMSDVARTARDALGEMRGIVRAGRSDPARGLEQLPDLVDAARTSGNDVTLTITGQLEALPSTASAAGYRVVQESLTNVRRHAGVGSTVTVGVRVSTGILDIVIRNSRGRGRQPWTKAEVAGGFSPAGTGLVAMQERIRLLGGTLEHGWAPDGRFAVHAQIPCPSGSAAA